MLAGGSGLLYIVFFYYKAITMKGEFINMKISPEVKLMLRRIAKADRRPMASVVRVLIEQKARELDRLEKKEGRQ